MRMITALVLVLGVSLAGIAVYLAQGQIGQFQHQRDELMKIQRTIPPLANVVVAKHALKYGERFTAADLDIVKMQADRLPAGTFSAIIATAGTPGAGKAIFLKGDPSPRAAMRTYEKYEPILADKVTKPGMDAGILAMLTPNMRAFTIQVDVVSGVSGFLRPGDRVDVYWSGKIGDQQVTKLIQGNLRLIAIDQSTDADRSEATKVARTVTAEVTPEQVAALALAQSTGKLTLSLIGMQDSGDIGPIEINRNELLGVQAPEKAPSAPDTCTVKTRKGTTVTETKIPCND